MRILSPTAIASAPPEYDDWRLEPGEEFKRLSNRLGLTALLCLAAWIRTWSVNESDDGKMELLRELRETHRLTVAVGVRHAEVGLHVLLDCCALVVAEQKHLLAADSREATDETTVVVDEPIAVQLLEVGADKLDEVLEVRTLRVARKLHAVHCTLCHKSPLLNY